MITYIYREREFRTSHFVGSLYMSPLLYYLNYPLLMDTGIVLATMVTQHSDTHGKQGFLEAKDSEGHGG